MIARDFVNKKQWTMNWIVNRQIGEELVFEVNFLNWWHQTYLYPEMKLPFHWMLFLLPFLLHTLLRCWQWIVQSWYETVTVNPWLFFLSSKPFMNVCKNKCSFLILVSTCQQIEPYCSRLFVELHHHMDRSVRSHINGANCTKDLMFLIKGYNLSAVPLHLPYLTLAQIISSTLKAVQQILDY